MTNSPEKPAPKTAPKKPAASGSKLPPLAVPDEALPPIERLVLVMAALRDPERGCPWDIEQSFETIAPYTIEEAYEVADAIAQGNFDHLAEELGDLLLQTVYHARMAEEAGLFDFATVADKITRKMVDRHPHVFGPPETPDDTPLPADNAALNSAWEARKAEERRAKAATTGGDVSALDGVSLAYPALMRALKLQKRAARVGFDWPELAPVLGKITEELAELQAELAAPPAERNPDAVAGELGDLLFSCVNLARHIGVDPETALRRTNGKFEARFRIVERLLADELSLTPDEANLAQMETRWQRAKADHS